MNIHTMNSLNLFNHLQYSISIFTVRSTVEIAIYTALNFLHNNTNNNNNGNNKDDDDNNNNNNNNINNNIKKLN